MDTEELDLALEALSKAVSDGAMSDGQADLFKVRLLDWADWYLTGGGLTDD